MTKRIPPHNRDAEQNILGSILMDSSELIKVNNIISNSDFYDRELQVIYEAMLNLYANDKSIDVISLAEQLKGSHVDKKCIANIAISVHTSIHAEQHARLVKQLSHERALIRLGANLQNGTYEEKLKLLENIPTINTNQHKHKPMSELIKKNIDDVVDRYKSQDDLRGIRTGFKVVDSLTDGFKKSEVVGMWADSNVGKSLFASDIARNIVKSGKTVLFFAYEMAAENMSYRVLADEMNIKIDVFNKPKQNFDEKVKRSIQAYNEHSLDKLHIYAEELENYTVSEVESYLRLHEQVDLVILDYLHLMETPKKMDRSMDKPAIIARELKKLARKYKVPIFALMSQTKGSQDTSKFVGTNELKHAVDQLWRLERDHENAEKQIRQTANLFVVKGRGNKKGKIVLTYLEDYLTFKDGAYENRY